MGGIARGRRLPVEELRSCVIPPYRTKYQQRKYDPIKQTPKSEIKTCVMKSYVTSLYYVHDSQNFRAEYDALWSVCDSWRKRTGLQTRQPDG